MNKYEITFKEWDEESNYSIRRMNVIANSSEDAQSEFYSIYQDADADVQILTIKQA